MIILSCDHGAFDAMQKLIKYFDRKKIEYKYMGPKEFDKNDDYPDYIIPACKEILKDDGTWGIFMCGSGIGANMVANRFKGIRAVNAQDTATAYLARKDENANVLNLGARLLTFRQMLKIIQVFLTSEFEGGRHCRRIAKY